MLLKGQHRKFTNTSLSRYISPQAKSKKLIDESYSASKLKGPFVTKTKEFNTVKLQHLRKNGFNNSMIHNVAKTDRAHLLQIQLQESQCQSLERKNANTTNKKRQKQQQTNGHPTQSNKFTNIQIDDYQELRQI